MLKLLAAPTLAAGLAGWFAFGAHHLGPADVAASLKSQMNGSSAGMVTRSVRCSGKTAALRCVLTSTRGTTQTVRVHVRDGEWRADWQPLRG